MKTTDLDPRTIEWVRINLIEGIGEQTLRRLMLTFKDPFIIYERDEKELAQSFPSAKKILRLIKSKRRDIKNYIQKLFDYNINVLTLLDQDYPNTLRNINNPPPLLYIRGELNREDDLAIAIVGSRAASDYGKRMAEKFARSLVNIGFTIISGMARGIDTIAQQTAVKEGGRTIAFLGSGLDIIYPGENRKLMHNIIKNGAVISEFPLGTKPHSNNFPRRNRLISGMSLGIVVVEATLKSGTFTTVKWALEQGKEVFAIPGDTYRRTSMGTNKLIQEGAKLVVEIDDIIDEFPFLKQKSFTTPLPTESLTLTTNEQLIFNALNESPTSIDDIIDNINLPSAKVSSILLSLEIKGAVKQLSGKRFIRTDVSIRSD